jgi:hypothetical protein
MATTRAKTGCKSSYLLSLYTIYLTYVASRPRVFAAVEETVKAPKSTKANTSKPRAKKVTTGRVEKKATPTKKVATPKAKAPAVKKAAPEKKTITVKKSPAKKVVDKVEGKVEKVVGKVEEKPAKKVCLISYSILLILISVTLLEAG